MPLDWGSLAPNKKWAVSPLISPPAGLPTTTMADKFVCIVIIRRFGGDFKHLQCGRLGFVATVLRRKRSCYGCLVRLRLASSADLFPARTPRAQRSATSPPISIRFARTSRSVLVPIPLPSVPPAAVHKSSCLRPTLSLGYGQGFQQSEQAWRQV